jgi:glyoxylase-like metal-dependent hydrolase (beta-lactamase superfamily II)
MTVNQLGTPRLAPTFGACCAALAATPGRMVVPRRADPELLARIQDVGGPKARRTVIVTPLTQAHQYAPTPVVAEGVMRPRRLHLGMTSFLVEHPQARFVVDPAMCADVHHRVLPQLGMLRAFVAPDKPVFGLDAALAEAGTRPQDIDFALPTHLHWDHVSGLLELPADTPVRTQPLEREWALGGDHAPYGVARGPLLDRTYDTYELDGSPVHTFERSHDLFGDGSVVLVSLPGHTPGSVGVLLAIEDGGSVLLAGDAVWHNRQIETLRRTAPFPGRLTDSNRDDAFETIQRLVALPQQVGVIPSHDYDAAARIR